MTIDFSNVAKYARICEKLKDDTQPIYDSGLLDFEKQVLVFGSQKGFGEIKMPVTDWDGAQKPFFVNLNSLLNVISEFPILELTGYTFKHIDDTFEIAHIEDDARFPSFIASESQSHLTLDANILNAIKRCGLFVDADTVASLNGIFVKDGSIWGTNKSRLYEEQVTSLANVDMALPRIVWETLAMDVLGDSLVIDKDDNAFFVSNDNDIKLQFAIATALHSPDIHDANFVSKFNHESFITLDKGTFMSVINFIQPFVAGSASQRVQFIIEDNSLIIKSADNGSIISRKIPIINKVGDLTNGDKIWVSANWIKTILSVLDGSVIKMQIALNNPAVNISAEGTPTTHVVYCRLVEI